MSENNRESTIEVRSRKKRWVVNVFRDIIQSTKLSHTHRYLWILLESYSSSRHAGVWPSVKTLCRQMGADDPETGKTVPMGRNKLFRLLKDLETAGLLERTQRRKKDGSGRLTSNVYILMDEPFYGVEPCHGFRDTEPRDTEPRDTEPRDTEPRDTEPRDLEIRDGKVYKGVEGDQRGSGGIAPEQKVTRKKKNRASRGADAPAAPGGADSSSSFVSGETKRGSAPDPVGGSAPKPRASRVGGCYPASLMSANGGLRGPNEQTSDEDMVDAFLYVWREGQKHILGRRPRLTQEDRQLLLSYTDDLREDYHSLLAMGITCWDLPCKKEKNGYEKLQTARMHGKVLKDFLNNLDKITQQLDWDHLDDDKHIRIVARLVKQLPRAVVKADEPV